jgi:hypothetical protein
MMLSHCLTASIRSTGLVQLRKHWPRQWTRRIAAYRALFNDIGEEEVLRD